MTEKKPSDPTELTELEPLEPDDLPELPELAALKELPELPELPVVEELPELPELPRSASVQKTPASAPPKPVPVEPRKPAPASPVAAKRSEPSAPKPPAPEPAKPKAPSTPPAAPVPAALTPEPAALTPEPAAADVAAAVATATATAAEEPPPLAPGEKPPLRVLDQAPLHLRKAAVIVCVGSLAPWMGYQATALTYAVAKVLVLAGAWLWLKQIDHNWGPKLAGLLGKLGDLELKPKKKDDKKPVRKSSVGADRPSALVHSFPTGLHVLSLALMLAGVAAMPFVDRLSGAPLGKAIAELGMFAWAAYTYVHIHAYERWGPFNPIFPMMFLAMLLGGFLMVAGGLAVEGPLKAAMMGGGLVVGIGGGLAAYTIVEAMMQAKKSGDAKKAAAVEARRQARKSGQ
jgi:hypothetical protein